jgi:hypothetical protein
MGWPGEPVQTRLSTTVQLLVIYAHTNNRCGTFGAAFLSEKIKGPIGERIGRALDEGSRPCWW